MGVLPVLIGLFCFVCRSLLPLRLGSLVKPPGDVLPALNIIPMCISVSVGQRGEQMQKDQKKEKH